MGKRKQKGPKSCTSDNTPRQNKNILISIKFLWNSIQLYVHINSQHTLQINFLNDRLLFLQGKLGNFQENIPTQQNLLKKIHTRPQGKKWASAFYNHGPFRLLAFKKILAQAIAYQKNHATLNEEKFNSLDSCPTPTPLKKIICPLPATAEGIDEAGKKSSCNKIPVT